jgi:hypothetical protein
MLVFVGRRRARRGKSRWKVSQLLVIPQDNRGIRNPQPRKGKTPKKLASICCPQRRETKTDTLKATEANRKGGTGTREKVSSSRINLEGNTHAQEINVSQCPV